jgi:hypothetical protein
MREGLQEVPQFEGRHVRQPGVQDGTKGEAQETARRDVLEM